jgi:hypothetical protein
MLRAIVSGQCSPNYIFGRLAAAAAELREHRGISLAAADRADDAKAGEARDVADNVMQLNIHLHQRLLHVLDVRRRILH